MGHSGVAPITLFDAAGYPVRIAAEVKSFAAAPPGDDRKLLKYAARHAHFALAAAAEAIDDAGIARFIPFVVSGALIDGPRGANSPFGRINIAHSCRLQ